MGAWDGDANGFTIEYLFQDHQLIAIRHQNGSLIQLEYENNRLARALGPDSTTVQYAYDDNGQLATVGTNGKSYLNYSYDLDKRLEKIIDLDGNILFEATYDDYNRAFLVKEGGTSYQTDFSIENKNMKVTDSQGKESIFQFDDKDRLITKKDSSGLVWEFAYEQDEFRFPTKMIDPRGGVTQCHYDRVGNLIYLKNAVGAEWRFFYDSEGNLFAKSEPNGRATIYLYNNKNQLKQAFFKCTLEIDERDRLNPRCMGYRIDVGKYSIIFDYDPLTGQASRQAKANQSQTSFTYHDNGEQKEIIYPTGYRIERKIDEKGRVYEISDGFGLLKAYSYNKNNQVEVIQTKSGKTQLTYDPAGRLKQTSDPMGSKVAYVYDSQQNLKEVTDEEDGVTSYEYNSLNQLTHITLPNGTCKTIVYDAFEVQEIWGR